MPSIFEVLPKNYYLPSDDPTRICPDISNAKDGLGWEPRVSIRDGLKLMVDIFVCNSQ